MTPATATHATPRLAAALLALALASLSTSACGPFSESCVCPGSAGIVVFDKWSYGLVASVSAGSTCTTMGADPIHVYTSTGETCAFTVQVVNGDTYRVTVKFVSYEANGCCAGVYIIDRDPGIELIGTAGDGGA